MNSANLPPQLRINLAGSAVLLLDANPLTLEVMSSVFYGFGAKDRIKCGDLDEARQILTGQRVDLVFIDAGFPENGAFEFMRWLRRDAGEPACFTPVIMLTGFTTRTVVRKARDCGAHAVLAKPITPGVLLNRMAWIAHEQRPFVNTEIYAGPDRRWKNNGPPIGAEARRVDDDPPEAAALVVNA